MRWHPSLDNVTSKQEANGHLGGSEEGVKKAGGRDVLVAAPVLVISCSRSHSAGHKPMMHGEMSKILGR